MRAFLRGVLCLWLGISGAALAQDALLKPFVLGSKGPGEVAQAVEAAKAKLTQNGFTIAGSYSPYPNATVIAVTNDEMRSTAAKSEHGGFGAALRHHLRAFSQASLQELAEPSLRILYRPSSHWFPSN